MADLGHQLGAEGGQVLGAGQVYPEDVADLAQ